MLGTELVVLCLIFFGICYSNTGGDDKNIKSFDSYPDEVQAIVMKNPELAKKVKSTSVLASFISNVVLFGIIFLVFGIAIKEKTFTANFVNLTVLGQALNAFDFFIIDLLWWRNSKRVRFSGTENRAELYRSPKKHFQSFVRGAAAFLVVALIDGFVLTLF